MQADTSKKSVATRNRAPDIQAKRKEALMPLAMPLAVAVLGYGVIGFLVIVVLIVLTVRLL